VSGPPPRGANGWALCPAWAASSPPSPQIAAHAPLLTQISCVLRPGSVNGADPWPWQLRRFLAETAPGRTSTAQVHPPAHRDYKPWLARRPGRTSRG